MTLTFEDARWIVEHAEEPFWASSGTFFVAPWGKEDETHYYVEAGAREALVDGDLDFVSFVEIARFVDKRNGDIERVPMPRARARIRQMTPVGEPPPRT